MKLTLCLFLVFCLFYSCTERNKSEQLDSKNDSLKMDTLQNEYAEAFRIIEQSEYFEIEIINPEDNSVEFKYKVGKSSNDYNSFNFNPKRVVALSATHIGMMEELNLLPKLVGISNDKYLCSEFLKDQVKNEKLASVGDIGMSDVEGYISVDPDLIIYSGFDTRAPILEKLKSAGLKTFTNYDWKETHPLGRAEWLMVFGVIFNKRDEAKKLFNEIKSDYLSTIEKVEKLNTEKDVLVGTIYGDIFNAPAGESYMAKLLEDANLDYKYRNTEGTGSISLTLEEVISENRKTHIWLNVAAQSKDKVLEMNSRFRLLESLENDNVYSYYHKVNCFWEKSAISPHLLLQDICKIVYPEEFKEESFHFYQKLD